MPRSWHGLQEKFGLFIVELFWLDFSFFCLRPSRNPSWTLPDYYPKYECTIDMWTKCVHWFLCKGEGENSLSVFIFVLIGGKKCHRGRTGSGFLSSCCHWLLPPLMVTMTAYRRAFIIYPRSVRPWHSSSLILRIVLPDLFCSPHFLAEEAETQDQRWAMHSRMYIFLH